MKRDDFSYYCCFGLPVRFLSLVVVCCLFIVGDGLKTKHENRQ